MKRPFVTITTGAGALLFGLLMVPLQGCTNLDETPVSAITPENFFRNDAEVLAGLAGVYAQLRSTVPEGGLYDANEVSSDEVVVPIRGPDWNDNGQWIDLHNQTWTPTSIATNNFFNGAWNSAYTGVARADLFITSVETKNVANKATVLAEARALRAFYYYLLMDMFGGVPIVTDLAAPPAGRSTRRQTFDYIESELLAARDSGLPDTWDAANNGRLTKGAANAILASMYINAGVWTKDGAGAGGINATGYNTCLGVTVHGGVDACQAAIDVSDSIINSGVYQLADSFPKLFRADNNNSPENIFVVKFIAQDGLGFGSINMAALHYCQYAPLTPWNGFSTLAQTYQTFDAADKRRKTILAGPQVDVLTGQPATIRPCGGTTPLVFKDTIPDITGLDSPTNPIEAQGARIYKWPVDPAHVQQNGGTDFAWFRLAEIRLIKAEALNEQSPGSAAALAELNAVRNRSGDPVAPALAGPITRAMILNERLFELFAEGKRRQDLIRFGGYTARTDLASGLAGGKTARADYYVLYPIPQTQINANGLLTQNPGF
jgi:hypothetical protein